MDTNVSPLLPAFQLLWKAAKNEIRKNNENDFVNANYGQSQEDQVMNEDSRFTRTSGESILCNGSSQSSCEKYVRGNATECQESVVVCTLECDHGDKFIRQIIHDGIARSQWSRAEDVFVDWLNSDLASQRAQRVDITIYFCRIPVSTCLDGICLWVKNLRDEGKEISIKVKVASVGQPITSRALEDLSSNNKQTKGKIHQIHELNEMDDTVRAIKRLAKMGAQIEPVSGGDWVHLISLLTDRASLHALDLKRSPTAEALTTILQSTL